jgi:hypothetical protein
MQQPSPGRYYQTFRSDGLSKKQSTLMSIYKRSSRNDGISEVSEKEALRRTRLTAIQTIPPAIQHESSLATERRSAVTNLQ